MGITYKQGESRTDGGHDRRDGHDRAQAYERGYHAQGHVTASDLEFGREQEHAHRHEQGQTDPFEIFMDYMIQEMKKQGIHDQLDKQDMREMAARMWADMFDQQRQMFVDAARQHDIEVARRGDSEQKPEVPELTNRLEKERKVMKDVTEDKLKKGRRRKKPSNYDDIPVPIRRKMKKSGKVKHFNQSRASTSGDDSGATNERSEQGDKKKMRHGKGQKRNFSCCGDPTDGADVCKRSLTKRTEE